MFKIFEMPYDKLKFIKDSHLKRVLGMLKTKN